MAGVRIADSSIIATPQLVPREFNKRRPVDSLDVEVLLVLPILVLIFSAYEIGALVTKKYHTISYYAQHKPWLKYLIYALFLSGGITEAIWWMHHMGSVIPQ